MALQLFPGWEAIIALGVVILVVGAVLAAARRRAGLMIAVIGFIWLVGFGVYIAMSMAGIYGKVAAEAGYVPNIVGILLLAVGVVGVGMLARKRKG